MQVMHSGLHSCNEKLELMLPVPHFINCFLQRLLLLPSLFMVQLQSMVGFIPFLHTHSHRCWNHLMYSSAASRCCSLSLLMGAYLQS